MWRFGGKSKEYTFEGEVYTRGKNFVGVGYTDPGGEKLWCYNTKVADMKINVYYRGRQVDELVAEKGAALEFVSREKNNAVPVLI